MIGEYRFFRKKQGFIGKCLRVREIKRKRCIPLARCMGKEDTPYYILFQSKHDGNFYGAGNHLAFPIRNKARHQLN